MIGSLMEWEVGFSVNRGRKKGSKVFRFLLTSNNTERFGLKTFIKLLIETLYVVISYLLLH